MKKAIFFLLLAILAFSPSEAPASEASGRPEAVRRVAVIVSAPIRPYMEALKGLTASLNDHGIQFLQPITLSEQSQEDFQALETELIKMPVDAYISIGPEAFTLAESVSRITSRPWVFSMVLEPKKLLANPDRPLCGLPLGLSASEQLQGIARNLPGRSRIGVLYSTAENRAFLEDAHNQAQTLGLEVHAIAVESPKKIPDRLAENLSMMDVLWILPDPAIDSKALVEYLVKTALLRNIPTVGYNRYFLEAGAALAFVLNYEKIGAQTAVLLDFFLHSGHCLGAVPAYDVVVNDNVLRRLLDHSKGKSR